MTTLSSSFITTENCSQMKCLHQKKKKNNGIKKERNWRIRKEKVMIETWIKGFFFTWTKTLSFRRGLKSTNSLYFFFFLSSERESLSFSFLLSLSINYACILSCIFILFFIFFIYFFLDAWVINSFHLSVLSRIVKFISLSSCEWWLRVRWIE